MLTGPVHRVCDFVLAFRFEDAPTEVTTQARRFLLDTLITAAAGTRTDAARRVRRHALRLYEGGGSMGARLVFDGRRLPPSIAAATAAGTIDSLDAHDGHALTKGHAGVAVVPATLAAVDAAAADVTLGTFLARVIVGYEVALRAGIALHRLAPEFHTSGAWNSLGAAAAAAPFPGLDREALASALGLAEFDAPRGSMMRVVDSPSMLKDGSRSGARVGLDAAYAARDGFFARVPEIIESPEAADLWSDLGSRWRIGEQYMKPYPVCRWSQPALEAAARLRPRLDPAKIERIDVATFEPAVRLGGYRPETGDQAQYALAYPLAAYLCRGRLGADELAGPALQNAEVLAMADRVNLCVTPDLDQLFPAERWCRLRITTSDGQTFESGDTHTRGDPDTPLTDAEIRRKADTLAVRGATDRIETLADVVLEGASDDPIGGLLERVLAPLDPH